MAAGTGLARPARWRLLTALLSAVGLLGCGGEPVGLPPTGVLVVIRADDEVCSRVGELALQVEGWSEAEGWRQGPGTSLQVEDCTSWPKQVAVRPKEGDGSRQFRLTVTAYEKERRASDPPWLVTRVQSGFVEGRWLKLEVMLRASCAARDGRETCGEAQQCGPGGCEPLRPVDPRTLPDAWPQDGGRDAAPPEAGPDAAMDAQADADPDAAMDAQADAGPDATMDAAMDATPDAAPPEAPSLSLSYAPVKTFQFTWSDVSGETEYRLLEDPDGASGLREVARLGADTTAHALQVFLPGRVGARYVVRACNDAGCTDSNVATVDVARLVAAIGYVKASNTGGDDQFGMALALSADGTTLAVGARNEDSGATGVDGEQADNSAASSGAVYVFTRDEAGSWSQQAYLKASNTGRDDQFGMALALSADGATLAVGAPLEDSGATGVDSNQADNSVASSGAVYVFTRDEAGSWSQQAYLKASNTGGGDQFGRAVALSADGTTLAVGALYEDSGATGDEGDNSAADSGAVYVFAHDAAGSWSQQAYLKASNTGAGDLFGVSVALSADGTTLAVGAFHEDSGATGVGGDQSSDSAADSGAVYVFAHDAAGSWSQQAYLKASNTGAGDLFGMALALSADGATLAVGAPYEGSGAVGVGGDPADDSAVQSGAVYVFVRNAASAWSQQTYLKASNTDAGDLFGHAVALSADGATLAVGAHLEDSSATGLGGNQANDSVEQSGAVYVLTRDAAGSWSQQAYLKASNTSASDWFGRTVALSADGATLAVSALYEDSGATGVGGDQADNSAVQSGAVYLY